MQKDKRNKLIAIAGVIVILIGVIAGVLIASRKELVNNNSNSTENLEFTKEFENGISISGDVDNIYQVDIKEILENSEDFTKYSDTVSHVKKHFKEDIKKVILLEVKFLDKDGEEFIPNSPITVYYNTTNASIYDGSYYIGKITSGEFEYCTDSLLFTSGGETTVYFEIDKSETISLLNYGEEREVPDEDFENPEKTEPVPYNVSEGYSVNSITLSDALKKYSISSQTLVSGINYINQFDGTGIVVELINAELDEDGIVIDDKVEYEMSTVSYLYLNRQEDISIDYMTNTQTTFEELYGFDYKRSNGMYDIYYNVLKSLGYDFNFQDGKLNKMEYALSGNRYYKIDDASNYIDTIMKDVEYDKILSSNITYIIGQNPEKTFSYPNVLNVNVHYEKDGKFYSRNFNCFIMILTEELLDIMLDTNFE